MKTTKSNKSYLKKFTGSVLLIPKWLFLKHRMILATSVVLVLFVVGFLGYNIQHPTVSNALSARDKAQAASQKAKSNVNSKANIAKAKAAEAARDREKAQAASQKAKSNADRKAAEAKAKRSADAREKAQAASQKAKSDADKKAAAAEAKAKKAAEISAKEAKAALKAREDAQANVEKAKSDANNKAATNAAAEAAVKAVQRAKAALKAREDAQAASQKAKSVANQEAAARKQEIANRDEAQVAVLKSKSISDQKANTSDAKLLALITQWATLPKPNDKGALPLDKAGCELSGWNYESGSCNYSKGCRKDAGKPVQGSKYNYCSNAVSAVISKSDCAALGRKWLWARGCARSADATSAALVCQKSSDSYVGGNKTPIDYCGDRKDAVARVRLKGSGAPVLVGSNVIGNDYEGCAKYRGIYAGICNGQCVSFVYYRLMNSGALPKKFVPLGNGRDVVNTLRGYGYRVDNSPAVGSTMSRKSGGGGAGHTAIVSKVFANGSVTIEEYNKIGGSYSRTNLSAAEVKDASNFSFAHTEAH